MAAEHYALETLAEGVADNPDAVTRFVLVSRPGVPAAPTGRDKTSLVAFMRDDHPGALLEILEQLTMRGVNLSRIESRPTGAALGNYCFSIDAEGHVADRRVGEALMGLRRICADVRFLGLLRAARRPAADDPARAPPTRSSRTRRPGWRGCVTAPEPSRRPRIGPCAAGERTAARRTP